MQTTVCGDDRHGILFNGTEGAINPDDNTFMIVSRSVTTKNLSLEGGLIGLTSTTELFESDSSPTSRANTIAPVNSCPPGVRSYGNCLFFFINIIAFN